jgi:FMN phosphatase YigB (HAD superfamily)
LNLEQSTNVHSPITARRYHTVFIDWDGTLSNSRFWQHWQSHPHYQLHYQTIQQKIFQNHPGIISKWLYGLLTAEEFVEIVAKETTLKSDILLKALIQSSQTMQLIDHRIPAAIQRLRQTGTKVVIATDNMDTFNRWTMPALKLHSLVDEFLNSHMLHVLKRDLEPDGTSKFFSAYLKQHAATAQTCLLIDDSPANQIVAKSGLNFIQITSQKTLFKTLSELVAIPRETPNRKYDKKR